MRVLDLYAGSGVLGFEALSRGAREVIAVEHDKSTSKQLAESAATLNAMNYNLVHNDAQSFIRAHSDEPFDLVFVDPPHLSANYEELCGLLNSSRCLSGGSYIYLEFSKSVFYGFNPPEGWNCYKSASAGQVSYQLWRVAGQED